MPKRKQKRRRRGNNPRRGINIYAAISVWHAPSGLLPSKSSISPLVLQNALQPPPDTLSMDWFNVTNNNT